MDDQNTVKKEAVVDAPREPEVINGVKVYPPSWVPVKSVLVAPKPMKSSLSLIDIEVTHVIIFIAITIFLFIGMWKRPNLR